MTSEKQAEKQTFEARHRTFSKRIRSGFAISVLGIIAASPVSGVFLYNSVQKDGEYPGIVYTRTGLTDAFTASLDPEDVQTTADPAEVIIEIRRLWEKASNSMQGINVSNACLANKPKRVRPGIPSGTSLESDVFNQATAIVKTKEASLTTELEFYKKLNGARELRRAVTMTNLSQTSDANLAGLMNRVRNSKSKDEQAQLLLQASQILMGDRANDFEWKFAESVGRNYVPDLKVPGIIGTSSDGSARVSLNILADARLNYEGQKPDIPTLVFNKILNVLQYPIAKVVFKRAA